MLSLVRAGHHSLPQRRARSIAETRSIASLRGHPFEPQRFEQPCAIWGSVGGVRGRTAGTADLRRLAVDVENALGTAAAIEQITLNPTRFDLVSSDWTRDGDVDAGPQLLTELARLAPDLPVLTYVLDASGERRRARRQGV